MLRSARESSCQQRPALVGVERLEDLVLDRGLRPLAVLERRAARARQLDEVAAAVVGIAQARHIAELLELVEQQHDVVGVHAEGVGEVLLGARVVVSHVRERDEVAELHPQQLLVAAPVELLGQAREQNHRPRRAGAPLSHVCECTCSLQHLSSA